MRAQKSSHLLFADGCPSHCRIYISARLTREGSARIGQDDLEDVLRDALLLDDGPVVRVILVDVARLWSVLLLEDVPSAAARVVPELVDNTSSSVKKPLRSRCAKRL